MTHDLPSEVTIGGRHLLTRMDATQDRVLVCDCDYQIELEPLDGIALQRAHLAGRQQFREFLARALREPTSLEILYYAQIGGPHVTAS